MELYMDEKGSRTRNGSRGVMAAAEGDGPFSKGSGSARGSSAGPSSFSTRFASLVKEQRARLYIMRRCVTMLICWRDYT